MLLPGGSIGGGAGHDDLNAAFVVVAIVPRGPQRDDLLIELDADAAAHTDDHGLAFESLLAYFEVLYDVGGDLLDAIFRSHQGFQATPFALELFFLILLSTLGDLIEARVDLWPFAFVQFERNRARFIINAHRCSIFYRAVNVVDIDVLAEDGARVPVAFFNRRAGEADVGGVGQGITHVFGEAVGLALLIGLFIGDDAHVQAVLAAVRFIGDKDDVASLGERLVLRSILGEELLNGGEDDAARCPVLEQRFKLAAILRLRGLLPEQLLAAREGAEGLIVEVVAIGEHDERGILHLRMLDDFSGVEDHREALAAALRMPDHTGALVPILRGGFEGGGDGFVDGVILMIGGHLLVDVHSVAFEDDKGAHEVQQALLLADAEQEGLKLWCPFGSDGVAVDGAPGLEALPVGGHGARACLDAIGDDQDFVIGEERGDLRFVGLELLKRALERSFFVAGIFEFDDDQRQAVDEDDDIRAAFLDLGDGELVDDEPVVFIEALEIDEAGQFVAQGAVAAVVLDGYAVDEQIVEGAVALDHVGRIEARHATIDLFYGLLRELGVEVAYGVVETAAQHDIAIALSARVCPAGRYLRPMQPRIAELLEPFQRRLFDIRLCHAHVPRPLTHQSLYANAILP